MVTKEQQKKPASKRAHSTKGERTRTVRKGKGEWGETHKGQRGPERPEEGDDGERDTAGAKNRDLGRPRPTRPPRIPRGSSVDPPRIHHPNASQVNFPGPSKVQKGRFLDQFHYFWWSGGICENSGFVCTKHPFWRVGGTPGGRDSGCFPKKRSAAAFGASLLQKFSLSRS